MRLPLIDEELGLGPGLRNWSVALGIHLLLFTSGYGPNIAGQSVQSLSLWSFSKGQEPRGFCSGLWNLQWEFILLLLFEEWEKELCSDLLNRQRLVKQLSWPSNPHASASLPDGLVPSLISEEAHSINGSGLFLCSRCIIIKVQWKGKCFLVNSPNFMLGNDCNKSYVIRLLWQRAAIWIGILTDKCHVDFIFLLSNLFSKHSWSLVMGVLCTRLASLLGDAYAQEVT